MQSSTEGFPKDFEKVTDQLKLRAHLVDLE